MMGRLLEVFYTLLTNGDACHLAYFGTMPHSNSNSNTA